MDLLSAKEIDYQYAKIASFLKQHEAKVKKYKQYKGQLYGRIQSGIKNNKYSSQDFPSLQIEVKPVEKAPLTDVLLTEFLKGVYDSASVRDQFLSKLNEFRKKKAIGMKPSVSVKTKHQSL